MDPRQDKDGVKEQDKVKDKHKDKVGVIMVGVELVHEAMETVVVRVEGKLMYKPREEEEQWHLVLEQALDTVMDKDKEWVVHFHGEEGDKGIQMLDCYGVKSLCYFPLLFRFNICLFK